MHSFINLLIYTERNCDEKSGDKAHSKIPVNIGFIID